MWCPFCHSMKCRCDKATLQHCSALPHIPPISDRPDNRFIGITIEKAYLADRFKQSIRFWETFEKIDEAYIFINPGSFSIFFDSEDDLYQAEQSHSEKFMDYLPPRPIPEYIRQSCTTTSYELRISRTRKNPATDCMHYSFNIHSAYNGPLVYAAGLHFSELAGAILYKIMENMGIETICLQDIILHNIQEEQTLNTAYKAKRIGAYGPPANWITREYRSTYTVKQYNLNGSRQLAKELNWGRSVEYFLRALRKGNIMAAKYYYSADGRLDIRFKLIPEHFSGHADQSTVEAIELAQRLKMRLNQNSLIFDFKSKKPFDGKIFRLTHPQEDLICNAIGVPRLSPFPQRAIEYKLFIDRVESKFGNLNRKYNKLAPVIY